MHGNRTYCFVNPYCSHVLSDNIQYSNISLIMQSIASSIEEVIKDRTPGIFGRSRSKQN